MIRKQILTVGISIFCLLCLSGCTEQIKEQVSDRIKEEAQDFLMENGEDMMNAIDNGLNALREYGAVGRKHYFENEMEAERYLLDGLKER